MACAAHDAFATPDPLKRNFLGRVGFRETRLSQKSSRVKSADYGEKSGIDRNTKPNANSMVVANAEEIVLLIMAYDRYVAICLPLHYHRILSQKNCTLITIGIWGVAILQSLLYISAVLNMSSCHSNIIPQFFCDPKSLTMTICTTTQLFFAVTGMEILAFVFAPLIGTFISYFKIFSIIFKMKSEERRRKAFSTCSSHIAVITIYYGTCLIGFLIPPYSDILDLAFNVVYTTVIPMINPIIYSLQNSKVEPSDLPGVDSVVDRLQQIWAHVVDNLVLSQEEAQRFVNRRRCVGSRLRVGDLVWLSSRHVPMKVSSPKFKPRFIGPYRISEIINPVSFRLALPASFAIHNVFHRSLLRKYVEPVVPSVDPPAPVLVDGELEYVVEKILDSRFSRRKLQYLVKCKGYGQEDNSWVSAYDVHATDLVRTFHRAHPDRPGGSVVGAAEEILLFIMAYDRYVAICLPLHYQQILSQKNCLLITIGIWAVAFLHSLLYISAVLNMSSCHSNVISQFFCDPKSLTMTSCTTAQLFFGVTGMEILVFAFVPLMGTFISYFKIFFIIFKMKSEESRRKAFSTCSSHIAIITIYYGTCLIGYLIPPYSDILELAFNVVYTTIIPMINPIIYSLQNSKVKTALLSFIKKMFFLKCVNNSKW
ncbi:unnamed protein product [Ranitomeya imitator]|uniref:Uncharacterized protein n=1 Tax=Ranitomeya imitator TaxID=111125 RepID=A0ABN9LKN1_9NEOB|nr:unnamed protein product [Ranitomeya imitator]